MSKSILRKDKTCLNCNYVVGNRFCPNCGQENTDTRKTFYHLFVHFFEDLTHYENAFWKTIKNLLLKPAALTKEYLSGKRLSYLAPVRLYIFISFITFFLITIFPNRNSEVLKTNNNGKVIDSLKTDFNKDEAFYIENEKLDKLAKAGVISKQQTDSLKKLAQQNKANEGFMNFGYTSVAEIDSIQKFSPESEKMNDFEYWINRKIQDIKDKNNSQEIIDKFKASFVNNLPKVLFLYMPIFAIVLWLFHNKKRWYYFDHGIFTLHYFSFLLLINLLLFLFTKFISYLPENTIMDLFSTSVYIIVGCWMLYYFYPAHHRFYGERRVISFIKSSFIFFINIFLILFLLLFFAIYTFINLH
jgi:hypothetical protein